MKKILSLLLVLLLCLGLAGCGNKRQEAAPSGPVDSQTDIQTDIQTDNQPDGQAEKTRGFPEDLAAFFRENGIEGLEFWILQDAKDCDFSSCTNNPYVLGSQGAYYGRKYDITPTGESDLSTPFVEYFLGCWPDLSDKEVYVTDICITDPDVRIYGLSLENTLAEWRETLTGKGYSCVRDYEGYSADMIAVSPDGTYIICLNSHSRSISVIAPSTNREGICND